MANEEIRRIRKNRFLCNSDKKIKYKTRWDSVTDKLDAELENEHNEGSTTIESVA